MIEATARVRSNPRCLLTELGDGTGVILHLDTKFYFNINDTGVFVWKLLAKQEHSASEIAARLSDEFDVSPLDAERDARLLLTELDEHRMLAPR